jgi:hypothetical protein
VDPSAPCAIPAFTWSDCVAHPGVPPPPPPVVFADAAPVGETAGPDEAGETAEAVAVGGPPVTNVAEADGDDDGDGDGPDTEDDEDDEDPGDEEHPAVARATRPTTATSPPAPHAPRDISRPLSPGWREIIPIPRRASRDI